MTRYHSFYSDETFMKWDKSPAEGEIQARQRAIREAKLTVVGEQHVAGQGITLVFEGPELDEFTQNLLCIKRIVE